MEENSIKCVKKSEVLPMREESKVLVKDVNSFFICKLCGGYLIDATGLVECFDTYCRSCIVQFLQKTPHCPVCGVKVNSLKPLHSLRPDNIMQRLVYKTVPGLFKNELVSRKKYLDDTETNDVVISDNDTMSSEYYFDPEEPISISLEYFEDECSTNIPTNHVENLKLSDEVENPKLSDEVEKLGAKSVEITYKRYLKCPAALKIRHIYKFIKLKFNLKKNHEVEILYDNTKLPDYFSLMDTAYTFSWKRENPMRLYYQIFEKSLIEVPLKIENKIPEEFVPTKTDSTSDPSALKSSEESFKQTHSELDCTNRNLKRKSDTSVKKCESDDTIEQAELLEPAVKIPRISTDMFKEESSGNELRKLSSELPNSENGLRIQIKTPSHDSGMYSDDYVKYEQDIEEVDDEDDDDDDDRLRISEDDVPTDKTESVGEQLVIDTSDFENGKEEQKEEKHVDDKKTKYRRKSKKSKHHHHKHHHHRHHERKKSAPQATILHSPDEDIMKLKVKLNNVKSETKHHKQSRRKRKKSPGNYFFSYSSSSSVSSAGASSPDTNSMSRADEDSLHSHISEMSVESVDTVCSKEEPSLSSKVEQVVNKLFNEVTDKHKTPTSKEKLQQMRAFRPKNIAVVKPEDSAASVEATKTTTVTTMTTTTTNDTNNNTNIQKISETKIPIHVIEINEKPKVTTAILRPTSSSSITVSKITAAEKMLMEQEKKMNGKAEERPSLEITLVTEPAPKTCVSPVTASPTTLVDSSNKISKVLPRTTKPVPPLRHLKSETPKPKSLSIIPYSRTALQPRPMKPNAVDVTKKINEGLTVKKDGMKQSVTISLSGNHFGNETTLAGALDLSSTKPTAFPTDRIPNVNMAQTLLNRKPCVRPNNSTNSGMPYNPVTSMSSLAEGKFMMQELQHSDYPFVMSSPRHTLMHSSKSHKILASPPRMVSKPQAITRPMTVSKVMKPNTIPPLNELKIVPVCVAETSMPKPALNQSVRNIPNPSRLLHRQQPINNVVPIMSPGSMPPSIMSRSCSFTNHKKGSDNRPPSMTTVYFDRSNVLATK